MKFTPKLPQTVPESLRFKPHDPGPLVKARTHEKKAEKLRDEGKRAAEDQTGDAEAPSPHLEFLERWKALEFTVTPIEERARHEWRNKLGVEPKAHEVIGHLIASLPRPRLDSLMKHPGISALNVQLGHRDMRNIIEHNELLQDLSFDWQAFLDAKRDLKFQLGLQSYKSALALAAYLTVVRAACDPKVRKQKNFVKDVEVLRPAGEVLRDITTHIIEEMQNAHDSFFAVGDRKQVGEQFRIDRAKRSGRPVPAADARKGRETPPADPKKAAPKPKPGALKG